MCSGRRLYPGQASRDRYPPYTRNLPTYLPIYLYAFHFFVGKCARAARGASSLALARGYRRERRIKPGFYYKRIQIPRTYTASPYSARSAEACGARDLRKEEREREKKREREKDREEEYKKLSGPRESPRGVNP